MNGTPAGPGGVRGLACGSMDPALRRQRLDAARLYFVCDAAADPGELDALLGLALAGGVDVIQLRDKLAPARALRAAASLFAEAAAEHRALFIVNDDPELAAACGADGVHLGQDDVAVDEARALLGDQSLVGLSTHRAEQLDAALAAPGTGATRLRQHRSGVGDADEARARGIRPRLRAIRPRAGNAGCDAVVRDRRSSPGQRRRGRRGRGRANRRRPRDPQCRGSRRGSEEPARSAPERSRAEGGGLRAR